MNQVHQQHIQIPVPGVQVVINTLRQMALIIPQDKNYMFVDQNFDGRGVDVIWLPQGLTLTTKEGKTETYTNQVGFQIDEATELFKYMQHIQTKRDDLSIEPKGNRNVSATGNFY